MASAARQPADDARPSIREVAVRAVRLLQEAGFTAYFNGGCVRDRLMGIEPKDYDVCTSARPDEVAGLFRNVQSVGESFGVMLIRMKGYVIEVATFRSDGDYSDGRHPDHVTYSDAEHDAQRRDFTINGMFEDPIREEVIDFVGGREDLAAGVIRAIGDPHARLREDQLRMLRAVRFAARFGFAIEAETQEAIRENSGELRGVSRERIGQEVRWMLQHPNRGVAAWELQYLGLDGVVLDEPACLRAPTRLGRLADDAAYPTALAAWMLDRAEEVDSPAPDVAGAVARWTRSLMLSNAEQSDLKACLAAHRTLRRTWTSMGVAAQKRLAASDAFLPALSIIQTVDREAFVEIRRRVSELAETGLQPAPLLTGEDLIAAGLTPGPIFKHLLDSVYDAQLEGSIRSPEDALRLAKALAAAEPSNGQERP